MAAPQGKATVRIVALPWATITVNGQRQGNTPLLKSVDLPAGPHVLVAEHPSFGTKTTAIRVAAGMGQTVTFNFLDD